MSHIAWNFLAQTVGAGMDHSIYLDSKTLSTVVIR